MSVPKSPCQGAKHLSAWRPKPSLHARAPPTRPIMLVRGGGVVGGKDDCCQVPSVRNRQACCDDVCKLGRRQCCLPSPSPSLPNIPRAIGPCSAGSESVRDGGLAPSPLDPRRRVRALYVPVSAGAGACGAEAPPCHGGSCLAQDPWGVASCARSSCENVSVHSVDTSFRRCSLSMVNILNRDSAAKLSPEGQPSGRPWSGGSLGTNPCERPSPLRKPELTARAVAVLLSVTSSRIVPRSLVLVLAHSSASRCSSR